MKLSDEDIDAGWVEWGGPRNGKLCPVDPETLVHIRLRYGMEDTQNTVHKARIWGWDHDRPKDDWIVAYRIVTPSPDKETS